MIASTQPIRIVIVGGGFGGVYSGRALEQLCTEHREIEVTLVSRTNYLLMTPLLFEAGSGVLEPRHAVHPIRSLLDCARFVEADVQDIDTARHVVLARAGHDEAYEIAYDHLIVAMGSVANRAILEGAEHAMAFKTLADAIFLRNYVIELFERADVEQDPQRFRQLLTFIVVGGGLVGVELMGELSVFTRDLCRAYRRIRPADVRWELIEHGPRLMQEMEADLADYAAGVLRQRGVRVRVNTPAKRMTPDYVELADGEKLFGETIILAAGIQTNPVVQRMPLEKDRKGRIVVDGTLRSRSDPCIWALGDCAAIPDPTGKPYPPLAQHALREAKIVAANVIASLHGQPLKTFDYTTLGMLAALGHYKGVGRIWRWRFRGFIAWWIWRTYYLMQMPGWERRLRIVLDWTIALLFRHDTVKLDLFGEEHPLRKYEERAMRWRHVTRERLWSGQIASPPQ